MVLIHIHKTDMISKIPFGGEITQGAPASIFGALWPCFSPRIDHEMWGCGEADRCHPVDLHKNVSEAGFPQPAAVRVSFCVSTCFANS